jgi:YD repeat-containing protein
MTQRDVYTYDGAVGSVAPKLEETKYDIYGNVTQVSNYDYGASYPPSTAPVSTTTTTYDINGACGTLSNPYIYDRPCSITTTNSAGTVVSQTNYMYNATGHVTQTSHWVAGSTYTTSSATYNSNGTIATTTDGNNHTTSFTYKACNGLFPTLTTLPSVNGVTQSTSQTWNCDGGVMTGSTDANGKTTTYTYADPIWRQTAISYPDGGSTSTFYSTGNSSPWTISTSTAINGGSSLNKRTVYDGLARVIQTQVTSDPIGTDYVDTTYDLLGRIHSTSNSHRSSPSSTDGITTYSYDALNRISLVSEPDGASESTSYSNYCKTITSGNNAHKLCSDGLGRLINVWEDPGLAPHLNYETDYGYDSLGNLTSVTQKGGLASGWQARSFAYDGLSRLTSASNPESGSVTYSYDGNGNVTSKTSPLVNALAGTGATQTVSYAYDALNRLSGKSYSDGITPSSCYQYDSPVAAAGDANPLGRMTLEWTQAGSCPSSSTRQTTIPSNAFSARAIMSHDAMGRVVSEKQYTPASQANGIIYVPQYNYDYAGDLVASTDGITAVPNSYTGSLCSSSPAPWATLTWTNCYDSAEHLTSVTSNWGDTTHPPSLFFGATYTAPGVLAAANYGNGTTLSRTYDNRLRATGETDSGVVVTSSTPGIAAVQITGAEQSK